VYARLITSRYELQTANDRYLYVGSASKYGSGLNGRVSKHIEKRSCHDKTRLHRCAQDGYVSRGNLNCMVRRSPITMLSSSKLVSMGSASTRLHGMVVAQSFDSGRRGA
jgi:hypothetical protein